MSKMSNILLFFLLLGNIKSILTGLNEEEKEAIDIKIGYKVEYDINRSYFQFKYEGSNESKIFFDIDYYNMNLILTYPSKEKIFLKYENYYSDYRTYMGNLTERGTYFLEVICESYTCELGGCFNSFILGDIMDTIDLSKNVYFKDKEIDFRNSYYYYGALEYKVSNLNENKYVYFTMETHDDKYINTYYFPYYPDEPPPVERYSDTFYHPNITIFEVINIHNSDETKKNVKIYEFKKGNEYIIRIHSLIYYYDFYREERSYQYKNYFFFQISEQNFKKITGEETVISSDGPMICLINPNILNKIFMSSSAIKESTKNFLVAKSQEAIEYNLESLYQISNLEFEREFILEIQKEDPNTTVAIIIPSDYESKVKLFLADEIEKECKESFKIPADTAKIIYCDDDDKELVYLNNITTFISNEKKMHIVFSEENEGTDFIIQNTVGLPIFVEKSDKEQTITVTQYPPRFTYFGAENPYLYNTLYNYAQNLIKDINVKNYMKLTQMNLRISSKYIPWNEFYNLFFNKLNMNPKINIYIKQIYGGSDLYECDADGYDERNLTFLITPISNVKCKNKKSLFNRLFNLDGTKILSGYITPDSYFDIYAEVNHEPENQIINISPIMKDSLGWTNTAKYLRKNIEYTLNFHSDHIVKLEPGFDAEITITNGQITAKINPDNPTFEISGRGYTIKSNNDAMVYFIGRFSGREMVQIEIDIERSKGKIVKISNIDNEVFLDIGFEGYYPSSFAKEILTGDSDTYYIYNLYDKLKGKLVDKEKIFLYYYPSKKTLMQIEYIGNNLENKNNDFNIFLIPANNELNSITIINSIRPAMLKTDFHFCKNDAVVQATFLAFDKKEYTSILTKENYISFNDLGLSEGYNMLSFSTDKPIIFTYSIFDLTDQKFFEESDTYWKERQEFILLKIEDVAFKKINDKTLEIKFRRNYKMSSTRYIILIAQKNNQNTLGNFANPCYIVDILNQRPSDLIVDTIYGLGVNELIYSEVDISKIKNNNDKYIINIISQELRFKKKIHFYDPIEFSHSGIIPYDDSTDSEITDGGNTDSDDKKEEGKNDGESSGSSTSLALGITIPIIGILLIAVIILVILRRKSGSSSEKIEKLTYN